MPSKKTNRGSSRRPNPSFSRGGVPPSSTARQANLKSSVASKTVNLELLPSISRSGGDDGQGDTLKDGGVQDKYWKMIQDKLNKHWKEFPAGTFESKLRSERESNILLHLRKLREGVLASRREDEFALSVYETSFYLAVIFRSPLQASTSLSHLPDLYATLLSKPQPTLPVMSIFSRAEALAIVSLIFHLDEAFPSQGTYYRHMRSFESLRLDWDNVALRWITSVRASSNCRNYTRLEVLTRHLRLASVVKSIAGLSDDARHLVQTALCTAVDALRLKLRSAAWMILRFSYREFTLNEETDTSPWLSRSLLLDSVGSDTDLKVEEWMEQRGSEGHAVAMEGFVGRWMLRR